MYFYRDKIYMYQRIIIVRIEFSPLGTIDVIIWLLPCAIVYLYSILICVPIHICITTEKRNHHFIKDTWGGINDDAATLHSEWRSLLEEGPPHVNNNRSTMSETSVLWRWLKAHNKMTPSAEGLRSGIWPEKAISGQGCQVLNFPEFLAHVK